MKLSRAQLVDATVTDILIRSRVHALRELAAETARTFHELRAHGVPMQALETYYSISMLQQRLAEQRER